MSVTATRPNINKGYGISEQQDGLLAWEWVTKQLQQARNYWISSTRPDGKPHATPVWGVWYEGHIYFSSHVEARRARNLSQNPRLSLHLESGDEVVIVEGVVEVITDEAHLQPMREVYAEKYAMPELAAAMPDSVTYKVKPKVVLAWLEKDYPNTATRWEFEG